jgi:hypothetical protein
MNTTIGIIILTILACVVVWWGVKAKLNEKKN